MISYRAVFIGISILVVSRLFIVKDAETAAVGFCAIALAGSLIGFSGFWAEYILQFGFLESFASDSKKPGQSTAAVGFLGWVIFLLIGYAAFFT